MEELLKDIAKWHEQTFDTDAEAQFKKLYEELNETSNANDMDEWYKEVADVIFVLAALQYRFNEPVGRAMLTVVLGMIPKIAIPKILTELIKKFEKNKKRVWVKQPDGTYHHAPNTD